MAKKSSRKAAKNKKAAKKNKGAKKASAAPKRNALGIQPLGDRVVVKPIEAEDERTPSGIIIPDSAKKEKPSRGKVVAVGAGRHTDDGKTIPVRVSVGDVVVFSKYGFDEVEVDGTDYYVISEGSILAIINK